MDQPPVARLGGTATMARRGWYKLRVVVGAAAICSSFPQSKDCGLIEAATVIEYAAEDASHRDALHPYRFKNRSDITNCSMIVRNR